MAESWLSLCLSGALPALPQDWWRAWSLAPASVIPLAFALVFALAFTARRRESAARLWFVAGWTLWALALVSPLCRLGATLAWAHMAQLMAVVAGSALWALGSARCAPARGPEPLATWSTRAGAAIGAATVCHAALLWLWHVPAVYQGILSRPTPHVLAWLLLAVSSWWFWHAVWRAAGSRAFAALLAVGATMAHTGLLGALLTFSGRVLYPLQAAGARAWGFDPLEDQQLAGLTMWVPGGLAYLGVALALGTRLLWRPAAARPAV